MLWIVLAVAGGSMFLCCGGVALISQRFKDTVKMDVVDTPAGTEAMTKKIAEIEILEGFTPQSAVDMDFVVYSMKMAIYQQQGGVGILMLVEMNFPNADQAQQKQQLEDSLQQQQGNRELNMKSTEIRKFTIRGKEVEFVFAEGTDENTGTAVRQVIGVFPGREGMGYLILQIDDESYDKQAVVRMIESIK